MCKRPLKGLVSERASLHKTLLHDQNQPRTSRPSRKNGLKMNSVCVCVLQKSQFESNLKMMDNSHAANCKVLSPGEFVRPLICYIIYEIQG